MVKLSPIKRKKKKAVSAIVGYVLVVTLGIIMSAMVYGYLKSYVPKDLLECPDGASIFLKDYECSGNSLNITLKNNGRFDLAGYALHAANDTSQEVATQNMVIGFMNSSNGDSRNIQNSYILFTLMTSNEFHPGNESEQYFNFTTTPKVIEITPVRFEIYNGKQRFASCGNAKTREEIICS